MPGLTPSLGRSTGLERPSAASIAQEDGRVASQVDLVPASGAVVVREHAGRVFYEAKFRHRGRQVKRPSGAGRRARRGERQPAFRCAGMTPWSISRNRPRASHDPRRGDRGGGWAMERARRYHRDGIERHFARHHLPRDAPKHPNIRLCQIRTQRATDGARVLRGPRRARSCLTSHSRAGRGARSGTDWPMSALPN